MKKKISPKTELNAKTSNEVIEVAPYDKVMKENAKQIFRPLLEAHLGVKFTRFEARPEKMQTTIEREMDFYHEIETEKEVLFYLHLEFQSEDEVEMEYRVGEYVAMARRRWKKPIKPVVIYLGKKPSKMNTTLPAEEIYTGFELISVREFCPYKLIASTTPEMIIMAILGNYPESSTDSIITMIISRLQELCSENQLNKFTNQLIILSRMRKLEKITAQKVDEMISYKVEEDGLYLMGVKATQAKADIAIQEAEEKATREKERAIQAKEQLKRIQEQAKKEKDGIIRNLLELGVLSVTDIAKIAESSIAYVKKIKQKL